MYVHTHVMYIHIHTHTHTGADVEVHLHTRTHTHKVCIKTKTNKRKDWASIEHLERDIKYNVKNAYSELILPAWNPPLKSQFTKRAFS